MFSYVIERLRRVGSTARAAADPRGMLFEPPTSPPLKALLDFQVVERPPFRVLASVPSLRPAGAPLEPQQNWGAAVDP